jgi:hypothetical protein
MNQSPAPAPSRELHGVVPSVCDAEAGPSYIVVVVGVTITRSSPQDPDKAAVPALTPSG